MLLIEAAYQEWARNRGDVEKLQRLHDAIEETLTGLADAAPDVEKLRRLLEALSERLQRLADTARR